MLTATQTYSPGDVITEAKSFIYALFQDFKGQLCDACFNRPQQPNTQLKVCAVCHRCWYCDRDCQRADWTLHKHECKVLVGHVGQSFPLVYQPVDFEALVNYNHATRFAPFMLRAILMARRRPKFFKKQRTFNKLVISFVDSAPFVESKSTQLAFNWIRQTLDLLKMFGVTDITSEELRLLKRLQVNANEVTAEPSIVSQLKSVDFNCFPNQTSPFVGVAITLPFAVMNHSCAPSTFIQQIGIKQIFIASKPIAVGDELTNTIIGLCHSTAYRQQMISMHCRPACRCQRCRCGDERDCDGRRVDYQLLADFAMFSQSLDIDLADYEQLLRISRGNPMSIFDNVFPNHHVKRTFVLVNLVRCDLAMLRPPDQGLVRRAVGESKITHPNQQVLKLDVGNDDISRLIDYLVNFDKIVFRNE